MFRRGFLIFCLIASFLPMGSCVSGGKGRTGYGKAYVSVGGGGSLSAPARTSALPSDITRATVTCTGPGMTTVEADLPLDGTPVLLEVPAGTNRVFTARAYAGSVLRMEGSETISSISPGEEITVTITLYDLATITITPSSATVSVGEQQQFTVQVTAHADTSVTWFVNGVQGGNSTFGTIDSAGLYSAPFSVPSPSTVTIRAVSNADSSLFAEAEVTITSPVSAAEWMRSYGMNGSGKAVVLTSDGRFLVGGEGGLLKLNSRGMKEWYKAYGCEFEDISESVSGGYYAAGTNGSMNACLVKTDVNGNLLWHLTYGGSLGDSANSVYGTGDGGAIVAGSTSNFGAGMNDVWLVKFDNAGNVQWEKAYGGTKNDVAYSVVQTSDGGYVVAGYSESFGTQNRVVWILKLDSNGDITWTRVLGQSDPDYSINEGYSIVEMSGGGYAVAGYSETLSGGGGIWILRLDENGGILWEKIYRKQIGFCRGQSIRETVDGGFIVAAEQGSSGFLLKLKSDGSLEWAKEYSFGSSLGEKLYAAVQTSGGGFIVVGGADPFDIDISDYLWVFRTSSKGDVATSCSPVKSSNFSVFDTTASISSPQGVSVAQTAASVTDVTSSPADVIADIALHCSQAGDYCLFDPIYVDVTYDAVDANEGDGVCADASGNCTLRAAISEANSCIGIDKINLPSGTYVISIAGAGEDNNVAGDLDVMDDVTISGSDPASVVIDGGGLDRVFEIHRVGAPYYLGTEAIIENVTVKNGSADNGGAIYVNNSSILRLNNSVVEESSATVDGGGIYVIGTAFIENSIIRGNTATRLGGGVFSYYIGRVTLTDSTVDGNAADNGGGIGCRGEGTGSLIWNDSKLTITGTTISGNTASSSGGGIYFFGSSTSLSNSELLVTNSTISGNTAYYGGGAYLRFKFKTNSFTNVTIAFNEAVSYGGVCCIGNFYNSIIANQISGGDCASSVSDAGGNLDSDGSCGFSFTADPLLGPLQDNGGPTWTHALLPGSPAIDAGDNNYCPATDQRGVDRSDGACDIGAYEYP